MNKRLNFLAINTVYAVVKPDNYIVQYRDTFEIYAL